MTVTAEAVKAVRQMTGAGILDCKKALERSEGDVEAAVAALAKEGIAKGIALANKRADSGLRQGLVETYTHPGGRVGAMVELNCATDFVARTDEFKTLAHDLALQVAAMAPQFVGIDDVPEGFNGSLQEAALWQQPFIRDPSKTVRDLVAEAVAKFGENIRVRRISRFELGN